jgi:hypothetical protein
MTVSCCEGDNLAHAVTFKCGLRRVKLSNCLACCAALYWFKVEVANTGSKLVEL